MSVPIPERKPDFSSNSSGGSWYDTIADAAGGIFNTGLDWVSDQINFERQMELLEFQQQASNAANQTNTSGGGYTQPAPTYTASSPVMAGMTPLTIGVMALAVVLLLRK